METIKNFFSSFFLSWSSIFYYRIIIYHSARYNCIKATQTVENGPQQNHKFIKYPFSATNNRNITIFSSRISSSETQKHKLVFEQK
jgi:hypothetical protein